MTGIEKNGWKLVLEKSGEAVEKDGVYYDFRNEASVIFGGEPPHKEGASGYVWSERGESYASVFGMEWVKTEGIPTEHDEYSQERIESQQEPEIVTHVWCNEFDGKIAFDRDNERYWVIVSLGSDAEIKVECASLVFALRVLAAMIEEKVGEDFGPMPFVA